jgi:hypothetical protein
MNALGRQEHDLRALLARCQPRDLDESRTQTRHEVRLTHSESSQESNESRAPLIDCVLCKLARALGGRSDRNPTLTARTSAQLTP